MSRQREDLTGQKFNHLTALRYVGDRRWMFRCDCGHEKSILGYAVKRGHTKSCGCLATNEGLGASRLSRLTRELGFWDNLKWKHRSIASWADYYDTTPAEIMQRLKRDKTL